MARVLLAWIGKADLAAAKSDGAGGLGPIGQAVSAREFEHVVLLNNFPKSDATLFRDWVATKSAADVELMQMTLSSPTHHGDIYRAATTATAAALEKHGNKAKLTFHLSPGTPAMASVWIIVAKTRFEAELIESSKEAGVETVDVPFELAAEFIPAAVERVSKDLERAGDGLRPEEPKFGDILHRSVAMKRMVRRARQAAPFSASVLIEGESGTGKELLAAAIHEESPRRGKPFEVVNCGAIPKELFESHFFGHEKGSFSGASARHLGHFEKANGGTLFLDEVGELPLEMQVKLLRAIQEKKVRRVGGDADVQADFRVIAATNRVLLDDVQAGRFREDLYFRLAVLVIRTPPLREREGDVNLLLDRKLEKLNETRPSGHPQKQLSPGARNDLLGPRWPGNVRELEAALFRMWVWSKGPVIDKDEARDALIAAPGGAASDDVLGKPLGDGFKLEETLALVARHYLERAVNEARGNKPKAASLVGFSSYQRLKDWLRKYEVEA